jgi:hypothetical protein
MLFVVKDGRKFRYIAVLEIRPWIKRQRLNERTACLNGKFLKDFHFLVQNLSQISPISAILNFIRQLFIGLYIFMLLRSNNQALQEHKIK